MSSETKPLPCPWCGKVPLIFNTKANVCPYWYVSCEERACKVSPSGDGCDTREEAIALWNNRASGERLEPAETPKDYPCPVCDKPVLFIGSNTVSECRHVVRFDDAPAPVSEAAQQSAPIPDMAGIYEHCKQMPAAYWYDNNTVIRLIERIATLTREKDWLHRCLVSIMTAIEEAAPQLPEGEDYPSTRHALAALKQSEADLRAQLADRYADVKRLTEELEELLAKVNSPETEDFFAGIENEAAHQRVRWPSENDAGKTHADWFWLVGYLAGKCLHAAVAGNRDKALHHTISTAAALANWHRAIKGVGNMRPGIATPTEASATETAEGEQP